MSANEAELVYFDARGLAEGIRLVLTYAGIQFRERNIRKLEDFQTWRQESPFKQFPLLYIDGVKLVQSRAIARYVAKKVGLDGDTPVDVARVDMFYEGTRDFMVIFRDLAMSLTPACEAKTTITQQGFPRYMTAFEKELADNGTGYLVGSKLSLADLGLFECLLLVIDHFTVDQLNDFPNLKKFYESLLADERINKYVKTVRKPNMTEECVKSIREILAYAKSQ
jgi:glutathione S-transferase